MKCSIVDIHTHRPTGKALEPSFAGIHPWQAETRRIEEIVPRFGEVDLVGEIGLDYAGTVGREAQLRIFREQLDWAERLGKPVENLFAETDESDVPIEEIYRRIAQAKDLDPELLKCAIYRNYREIFER